MRIRFETELSKEDIVKLGKAAKFICPLCSFQHIKRAGIRKHLKKNHCKEDTVGQGFDLTISKESLYAQKAIATLTRLEEQDRLKEDIKNKEVL